MEICQISLIFCLRRTVSRYFIFKFYNAISVHGISPRSRQAGDNRGFYCTVMEVLRGRVLYHVYRCPISCI